MKASFSSPGHEVWHRVPTIQHMFAEPHNYIIKLDLVLGPMLVFTPDDEFTTMLSNKEFIYIVNWFNNRRQLTTPNFHENRRISPSNGLR